jgi:hypothetical protein
MVTFFTMRCPKESLTRGDLGARVRAEGHLEKERGTVNTEDTEKRREGQNKGRTRRTGLTEKGSSVLNSYEEQGLPVPGNSFDGEREWK